MIIISLLTLLTVIESVASSPWSSWSAWSECSRLCDGGASYQLRDCRTPPCSGELVRYKRCNGQACEKGIEDFRSQQCAAYNDQDYDGRVYRWFTADTPESRADPCALWCWAEETRDVRRLAPKVLDGTRCRPHGLDMCLNGVCQAVGCDGILGSDVRYDICGVCDGDGSTCSNHDNMKASKERPYVWEETAPSDCSVSCGVGKRSTTVHCKDTRNNKVVTDWYCEGRKPSIHVEECTKTSCHPTWLTTEWQPCTRSCGGGLEIRNIYCVEQHQDGTFQRTYDSRCGDNPPVRTADCNPYPCPSWIAGEWSPCSVTCGEGRRYREVICKRTYKLDCQEADRPIIEEKCANKMSCMGEKAEKKDVSGVALNEKTDSSAPSEDVRDNVVEEEKPNRPVIVYEREPVREDEEEKEEAAVLAHQLPGQDQEQGHAYMEGAGEARVDGVRGAHGVRVADNRQEGRRDEGEEGYSRESYRREEYGGEGHRGYAGRDERFGGRGEYGSDGYGVERTLRPPVKLIPGQVLPGEGSGMEGEPLAPPEPKEPSEPSEPLEPWDGEFSHWKHDDKEERISYGKSPSHDESVGEQQITTEPRFIRTGWGVCSKSCGEGVQYRRVQCKVFLAFTQEVQTLEDSQCPGTKPETGRACELEACVPQSDLYQWYYIGYSECSVTCGAGQQTPMFMCMETTLYDVVDNVMCENQEKPPIGAKECSSGPCPASWRVGEFGPCSVTCGGGEQVRIVRCAKETGSGIVDELPPELCAGDVPDRSSPCSPEPCPPRWHATTWSECSRRCGGGVQKRVVTCKRFLPGGQEEVVTEEFCGVQAPASERPCLTSAPCPTQTLSEPYIEEDTTLFTQLLARKKVVINVGGVATIIEGTTVQVRCPVKGFDRRKLMWRRSEEDLGRKGRVKVTRGGMLRIRKSRENDAGVYTCTTGSYSANISVSFISQQEAYRMFQLRRYLSQLNSDFIQRIQAGKTSKRGRSRDQYSLAYMLRRTNSTSVPFYFVPGEWSACSRSCGGAGLQSRDITCEVILDYYKLSVEDHWCLERGKTRPIDTRDCGYQSCPMWSLGSWQQCSADLCMSPGIGSEKRAIHCVYVNGSEAPLNSCDAENRPPHKRDCQSAECRPMWKTTPWTKCSKSCGGKGVKTRALKCVWEVGRTPAGKACRDISLPRPVTTKTCRSQPCHIIGCRDRSKFCNMIPRLQMCRYEVYRRDCCHSCKAHNQNKNMRRSRKNL